MNRVTKSSGWAALKIRLDTLDRKGLVGVVHDLSEASEANRRFLGARFLPSGEAIEEVTDTWSRLRGIYGSLEPASDSASGRQCGDHGISSFHW